MSVKIKYSVIISYAYLFLFSIICIFPFIWLLFTSIKIESDVFSTDLLNAQYTIKNYLSVLSNEKFYSSVLNSFIISSCSIIFVVPIGFLGGYYFSRWKTPSNQNLFLLIISTRIAPPVAFAVPIYIMYIEFGFIDKFHGIIGIYVFANLALSVWLSRGIIDEIPSEIEEASKIDGCNLVKSLYYILMPMSKQGIISICLIVFILTWNEFLFASILTRNDVNTFTVHLTSYFGSRRIEWSNLTAASVLVSLLPVLVTLTFRKYLIRGISIGKVR